MVMIHDYTLRPLGVHFGDCWDLMLNVFKCSKSCAASKLKVWMLYVYSFDASVLLQRLQCETTVFVGLKGLSVATCSTLFLSIDSVPHALAIWRHLVFFVLIAFQASFQTFILELWDRFLRPGTRGRAQAVYYMYDPRAWKVPRNCPKSLQEGPLKLSQAILHCMQ